MLHMGIINLYWKFSIIGPAIHLFNLILFGHISWAGIVSCFYYFFGILKTQMLQKLDCKKSLLWWIISVKLWLQFVAQRRIVLLTRVWCYGGVDWYFGNTSKERDINTESKCTNVLNQVVWSWDRLSTVAYLIQIQKTLVRLERLSGIWWAIISEKSTLYLWIIFTTL